MKTYIVQFRPVNGTRLVSLGEFRARTSTGAILQGARVLACNQEEATEIVATPKG